MALGRLFHRRLCPLSEGGSVPIFAQCRWSLHVQVFGRRHDETIGALMRSATEKRRSHDISTEAIEGQADIGGDSVLSRKILRNWSFLTDVVEKVGSSVGIMLF